MTQQLKIKSISFESIDGGGKGTAIKGLKEHFENLGIDALFTREPGGCTVSEELREIVLREDMTMFTEAMIYATARGELLRQVVFPAISDGKVIVLDRYVHSSYVYQGFAGGLGYPKVKAINDLATEGWMPDLTFIFDLPPEVGMERVKHGETEADRIEKRGIDFQTKVREGYLQLIKENPKQFVLIDASQSREAILKQVIEIIEAYPNI